MRSSRRRLVEYHTRGPQWTEDRFAWWERVIWGVPLYRTSFPRGVGTVVVVRGKRYRVTRIKWTEDICYLWGRLT